MSLTRIENSFYISFSFILTFIINFIFLRNYYLLFKTLQIYKSESKKI